MRGTVYGLRPPRDAAGHDQSGQRYAVVVQTTRLEHLSTWLIVPTSSSPAARRGLLRPVIDFGQGECVALVDQLRSVDREKRLTNEVGHVSLGELRAIDRALRFILDLD